MPADLALLPLNTVAHALTNDDALRWLAAAGNALRPEGLLVMELPPLDDVFNGNLLQVCHTSRCHSVKTMHPELSLRK